MIIQNNELVIFTESDELEKQNIIINSMKIFDRDYIGYAQKLPPGHIDTIFAYDKKRPIGFVELNKLNGISKNIIYIIYAINPNYRGKGIIQDLIIQACYKAYNLGYKKVISVIDKKNIKSIKALVKTNLFTLARETTYEVKYECILNNYF